MKKSKFTEAQIVFALNQAKTGVTVAEVCRKMGISEATFYNWKKKYASISFIQDSNLAIKRKSAPFDRLPIFLGKDADGLFKDIALHPQIFILLLDPVELFLLNGSPLNTLAGKTGVFVIVILPSPAVNQLAAKAQFFG